MKLNKRTINSIITLIIVLVAYFLGQQGILAPTQKQQQNKIAPTLPAVSLPLNLETAKVAKVIDGDTIQLENGKKVRYIGIDTPETVHPTKGVQCYGKEASNKNKELLQGKTIQMEKDVSETDRYGRLLRYVYLPVASNEAIFVNKYLVEEGYARAATFPPDVKNQDIFREAEKTAREGNKGLWKDCE